MNYLAISLAVGASALFTTAAFAAPLSADVSVPQDSNIQNVRVVCNDSGRCWHERGERRVIIGEPRDSYGYAPRERYIELLGQSVVLADDEALAREVRAFNLGEIALVEKRQLQGAVFGGKFLDRRGSQRGDPRTRPA